MVFVGEERREIVADLVTAFDEIKGGGTSRLVTLVSMPGWGKTRIIQEFYSSLALEQNEPHYWPDSLVVIEDGEEGILGARKLVHPAHMTERPDGAALDYMWWGISCKKDPNSSNLEEVLDRAAEQVANHALGRQSLEELKGEFLGASVDLSTNLLSVLGLVGLVVFPPLGAAGTIVGAAKFAWDRREAFQRTKTALAERRAKGRPIDLATSREEADDQLVRFLTRWSAKVPMVIVLDDAQWATERTISVLNQLLTSNESRVLIVATTWPHEVSTINALGGHAHHFQERWADWQQRLPERVSQVVLEPFNDADAGELFDAELPGVDSVTKAKVLARVDHNPLVLRLCLRVFGEEIQSGDFNEDLIPNSVEDAFRLIWKEFPKPIQQFLALAAHLGQDYFVDLLDEVTTATLSEGARKLATKSAELNWVKSIDEILQSFGEVTLFDITVSSDAYKKATKDHKILRAGLQTFTSSEDFEALSNQAKIILLQAELRLAKTHRDMDPILAAEAGLRLRQLHAEAFHFTKQETCLEDALELLAGQLDTDFGFKLRSVLGLTKSDLGKLEEAESVQNALLEDQIRIFGAKDPITLGTQNNLAVVLTSLGRHEDAMSIFQIVLDARKTVLKADHPDIFRAAVNLAHVMGLLGDDQRSLLLLRELLASLTESLGADHPDVISLEENIALSLNRLHHNEAALELQTKVLRVREITFGPEHPETLQARCNFAITLSILNRNRESLEMHRLNMSSSLVILQPENPGALLFKYNFAYCSLLNLINEGAIYQDVIDLLLSCLDDHSRILGIDHPQTLSVLNGVAWAFANVGDDERALELRRRVFDDRLRVLGADHPDTFWAKSNIAQTLRKHGCDEDALLLQREVLKDRMRVIGPNHPDTLSAKWIIAATLRTLNRYEEEFEIRTQILEDSIQTLELDDLDILSARTNLVSPMEHLGRDEDLLKLRLEILDHRLRVSGTEHLDTLGAKWDLADALDKLGRHQESFDMRNQILEDSIRTLEPDDHIILRARANLGISLGRLGRHEEAIDFQRQVVGDFHRVFGPEDPDLWEAQRFLGISLQSVGRFVEAIELQSSAVNMLEKSLGSKHIRTLQARNSLGVTMFKFGKLEAAATLQFELVSDEVEVLGIHHRDTFLYQCNLANTLRELGRLDEAIELHRQAVGGLEKVLGSVHPNTLGSRCELAKTFRSLGQTTKALEILNQTSEDFLRVLGGNHPDTLEARLEVLKTLYQARLTSNLVSKIESLESECLSLLGGENVLSKEIQLLAVVVKMDS